MVLWFSDDMQRQPKKNDEKLFTFILIESKETSSLKVRFTLLYRCVKNKFEYQSPHF